MHPETRSMQAKLLRAAGKAARALEIMNDAVSELQDIKDNTENIDMPFVAIQIGDHHELEICARPNDKRIFILLNGDIPGEDPLSMLHVPIEDILKYLIESGEKADVGPQERSEIESLIQYVRGEAEVVARPYEKERIERGKKEQ